MRLDGKVAIVTGSSRGIGKAIALAFAKEGADIVVNYVRSEESAREVASSIEKIKRKALVVKADVSDTEAVKNMVDRTLKEFGRIDILVNNTAGSSAMDSSLDYPDWDGWERMMVANTKGILICSQAVSKHMLDQKKRQHD